MYGANKKDILKVSHSLISYTTMQNIKKKIFTYLTPTDALLMSFAFHKYF